MELPTAPEIITIDPEGNITGNTFMMAQDNELGHYMYNGFTKIFYVVKFREDSEFKCYEVINPNTLDGAKFKTIFLLLGIELDPIEVVEDDSNQP
jgi:hypothetical protein